MFIGSKWYRFIPVTLVMGILFYLSHQPGDSFELPDVVDIDKLLHSLAYGCLAVTALFSISREFYCARPVRTGFLVVAFCFFYGVSDEVHQMFVPDRYSSVMDLVADTMGAVVAVILWAWLRRTGRMGFVSCKAQRLK